MHPVVGQSTRELDVTSAVVLNSEQLALQYLVPGPRPSNPAVQHCVWVAAVP